MGDRKVISCDYNEIILRYDARMKLLNYGVYSIIVISGNFMAGNFLAGDFLAHSVTFGDFIAGNVLAGHFLGGYRSLYPLKDS